MLGVRVRLTILHDPFIAPTVKIEVSALERCLTLKVIGFSQFDGSWLIDALEMVFVTYLLKTLSIDLPEIIFSSRKTVPL